MHINGVGKVGVNPYVKQAEKINSVKKQSMTDKMEISQEALQLSKGNPINIERKELVDKLKNEVQSGEYKVDTKAVAQKMYSFWNNEY